ncbi:hypothetical protein LTR08_008792 [Meristemomyces frigidus]|nr:hypothetical protein LTR08_008792 [Meristemomyces frigidus]
MSQSPPRHRHSSTPDLTKVPTLHHDSYPLQPSATATTSGGMTISPELFEKLYLTPKVPHVGDNYKRFANPTPMGLVGFVISTFTFACVLMGWGRERDVGGRGHFLLRGPGAVGARDDFRVDHG